MNDDELLARLAHLDPMPPSARVDPIDSDRARALEEHIMATPTLDAHDDAPTASPRSRWVKVTAVAAAAAAAIGIATLVIDDEAARPGADKTATTAAPVAPVALGLAASDPTMTICAQFDPSILAAQDIAFRGTVETVAAERVTLTVDEWFKGGAEATAVEISTPEGTSAALDGVDFVDGSSYLVSATDGQVATCGLSAPDSPEMRATFTDVFGG